MIKKAKCNLLNQKVEITKLSAHAALKAHAQIVRFISPSISGIIDGVGKPDEQQAENLSNALSKAFENTETIDDLVAFIDKELTGGNIIVNGSRINHLDDLDAYEDVDGSELMYLIFTEWVKLNLGALLKKIGSHLTG